ncbi:GTPase-activating protein [Dissophora globulifera]|nr:GTPase-activating protein [Dissophora globulifera]
MMVNKRNSFTSQDGKDYDPIHGYANAEPNTGHAQPHTAKGHHHHTDAAVSEEDNRHSWEENNSDNDDEPYDYGHDYDDDPDEDDEDDDEDPHTASNDPQQATLNHTFDRKDNTNNHTFDQASASEEEGDLPNRNMFRAASADPRASLNSGKSYSSHTKHHSFGYDQDRPEPSESESESNSESESDNDEPSSFPAPATIISSGSRPASKVASPVLSRATVPTSASNGPFVTRDTPAEQPSNGSRPSSSPASPTVATSPRASPRTSPRTSLLHNTNQTTLAPVAERSSPKIISSLASAADLNARRTSGSESDASNTSNRVKSPTMNGHLRNNQTQSAMTRSNSTSSSLRGMARHHPTSYSDFSDADLNEVSLDEPTTPNGAKRRSIGVVGPRVPVAASNAGFPSSFFGGKPHPKAQQYQQQQPPLVSPQPVAITTSAHSLPPSSSASPEPRPGGVLNGSMSSFASTIQGASAFMGRAFGGGNSGTTSTLPPPAPSRTPSRTSVHRTSGGMVINTASVISLRSSNNVSPERASMYSSMTTDSNMELLLQRLDSENPIYESNSIKRTMTNDSEMDRALGHAKEESTGEDVDWDYWGALMHDYNGVVKKNPKQLTQMIQKGVPPALRGLIWQLLAKSKDAQLESTYAELLKSTSSHEKQINRDMSRTFPNHEYFQAEGLGQESLFNVMKAYSLYDTEVGYCQGLSFVVGPLLLNMPDEEAFCVLVRLMNSYDMRGHFTPDMNTLQLRLYQFEQLMEETVPIVHKHFQNQGIRSTMYASQWFMTLFAYKFPLDLVFRIYDILFVEGVESLLRFAIALLKANHDKILNHDFDTLVDFLKNGLFDHYKNNPSLFVQDAYNVKVTPKKLAQYAQKYNTMLQRQQAELAAEDSLRESNRQLSMHVRRLEGSLYTLNKEHVDLAKELITRKVEMANLQNQNDVLSQKVSDLTRIVDSQAKEVEDRLRAEIQSVMEKNVELIRQNEQVEDQCHTLESMLIESKMKYAESENDRDALTRKLSDLRKALGIA